MITRLISRFWESNYISLFWHKAIIWRILCLFWSLAASGHYAMLFGGGKEQHEHSSKYHLLCFTKNSNGLVNDNITFLFLQKYSHILQLLISSNNYSVHYFITSAVDEYSLCFLSEQVKKSISEHLCTVADFANEMFDVLDAINYQSYNDFVLRVGEWPCWKRGVNRVSVCVS